MKEVRNIVVGVSLLLFLISTFFSCGPKVENSVKLFSLSTEDVISKDVDTSLNTFTALQIDLAVLKQLSVEEGRQSLEFDIPYDGEVLTLELKALELFADGFKVNTDKDSEVAYTPGTYYSGKVKGDNSSLVSVSIFDGEVNGIISSETLGTLNLGETAENSYVIYSSAEVKSTETVAFECGSSDDGLAPPELDKLRDEVAKQVGTQAAGCVTVDFELTNGVYTNFGSNATSASNWFTSLFAGVKSIYLAEGIDIKIKSIYIWTTPDGYSSNASSALNELVNKRKNDPAFTGNFVHLVRGQSNNLSGIAYVGVLCIPQYRFGFSAVLYNYAAYPAFSWSTMVITHELGHNMGSPHTHSCTWPGGAIDNCYTQEGSCAPGPQLAQGKGTIMSYCHMTSVGINFANGFGPLPGDKIRQYYNLATCLTSCVTTPPPTATCSDGIKNQNETGIDCGGVCPPCPIVPPTAVPVSQGKPSSQSSSYSGNQYPSSNAFDGVVSPNNFSHTNSELKPWIEVDLGGVYNISTIEVTNRSCSACGIRIKKFQVLVDNVAVYEYNTAGLKDAEVLILKLVNPVAKGRVVRILVDNGTSPNYLNLAEIKVFGTPSTVVCKDTIYRVLRDSTGKICR